jgi:transcriptional regulator with XRE-family HTH domain
MYTKFGRQPFMDILKDHPNSRGKTLRQLAAELGVPFRHLRHAGYGYVMPKYVLRRALSCYLDLPDDELFSKDALRDPPMYRDWHIAVFDTAAKTRLNWLRKKMVKLELQIQAEEDRKE